MTTNNNISAALQAKINEAAAVNRDMAGAQYGAFCLVTFPSDSSQSSGPKLSLTKEDHIALNNSEQERADNIPMSPWPARFIPYLGDSGDKLAATLVRVPKLTLKQAGWKVIRDNVLIPKVKAYIDTEDGVIYTVREMYQQKFYVPNNFGLLMQERMSTLNKLRGRVRELAGYLLSMRNNRGGFVQTLETLVDGYINREGKVTDANLARSRDRVGSMIGKLSAHGIIANETTLGVQFQLNRLNSARDNLEEASVWYGWPGIFQGKKGYPD